MGKGQKKKNKGKKTTQNSAPAQNKDTKSNKKTKLGNTGNTPLKTEEIVPDPIAVEESPSQSVEETSSISHEEIDQDNNQDTTANDAWFEGQPDAPLDKSVLKDDTNNELEEKTEDWSTDIAVSATSAADRKENDNQKPYESKHENTSGCKKDNDECKSNKRNDCEIKDKSKHKRDDKSKERQGSSKYENNQNQKFSDKKHSSNVDGSKSSYKEYKAEDASYQKKEGSWRDRSNKDYGNQSKGETYGFNKSQDSPWGNQDQSKAKGSYSYKSEDNNTNPWEDQPRKRGKGRDSSPNKRQGSRWEDASKGANTRWDSPNRNYQNNVEDPEYKEFYYNYRKKSSINYIRVQEIDGDLFAMAKEYSLAHCVAEDLNMGSGIAVQFSQQFKRRDELYQQRQRQGGLAILDDNERYIYYLITKKLSNGKPTYHTLWSSLKKLQQHIEQNGVKKLAIPRIGCGLDRLDWPIVKPMLEFIFKNTNVLITVCNFQQNHGKTKQKLKQKSDTDKKGKQLKIDEMTKKTKRKK